MEFIAKNPFDGYTPVLRLEGIAQVGTDWYEPSDSVVVWLDGENAKVDVNNESIADIPLTNLQDGRKIQPYFNIIDEFRLHIGYRGAEFGEVIDSNPTGKSVTIYDPMGERKLNIDTHGLILDGGMIFDDIEPSRIIEAVKYFLRT